MLVCIDDEKSKRKTALIHVEGKHDVHKVRMYGPDRYENIKVKTQTSVKEENIRKYDLICVSWCGLSRDVARIRSIRSLVFFIFSEGLQSSCVYTARGREMIVEKERKNHKIIFFI